ALFPMRHAEPPPSPAKSPNPIGWIRLECCQPQSNTERRDPITRPASLMRIRPVRRMTVSLSSNLSAYAHRTAARHTMVPDRGCGRRLWRLVDGGAVRTSLHDAVLNLRLLAQEVKQDQAAQHQRQ